MPKSGLNLAMNLVMNDPDLSAPDYIAPCYVAIDWSGAKPGSYNGSVAVSITDFDGNTQLVDPPDGEYWSRHMVYDWLGDTVIPDYPKVVIGIDANLSLTRGFINAHLGDIGDNATAMDLWRHVDDISMADDFYAREFVQHYSGDFWSHGKKPDDFDVGHRRTDMAVKSAGLGHPQGCFALIGAKTVGLAGLSAMRLIHQIRMREDISVWPYQDRSFDHPTIIEIYPRFFIRLADGGFAKVSETQAIEIIDQFDGRLIHPSDRDLDDHDTDALVGAAGMRYLDQRSDKYDPWDRSDLPDVAINKEGWIFGAEAKQA